MKVVVEEKDDIELKIGDILIFGDNNKPYMIIKHRDAVYAKGPTFDLVCLSDPSCYWSGALSWSQIKDFSKEAKAIYSIDEYEMVIRKK